MKTTFSPIVKENTVRPARVVGQLCTCSSWQPQSFMAALSLKTCVCISQYICPQVHVLGCLSIRPAVLQAGTGPVSMCRVTKQGFGLFELWEKEGDKPPATGALPCSAPQPCLSTGSQVGPLSCGPDLLKTSANIEQDLGQTQTHLLSYSLHC